MRKDSILFYNLIKKRSIENKKSFKLLYKNKCYGNCISIFRQELDSLIRLFFITNESNTSIKNQLISKTLAGEKWVYTKNGKQIIVTDRQMIDKARFLYGWNKDVYKIGCGFIHLSNMHNYSNENIFLKLSKEEREDIIEYIKICHGIDLKNNLSVEKIIPILPNIIKKISDNLIYHLEHFII